MNRLHKKCLLASTGLHAFLLLVLVLGSAFFVPKQRPASMARMILVPADKLDDLLEGGGGNPKLPPSDERQKGETLAPQPAPQPVQPAPRPRPAAPAPAPRAELPKPPKPANQKPRESVKDTKKPGLEPTAEPSKLPPMDLVPVVRGPSDREKAAAEAEAREAAASRQRAANQLAKAANALSRGFKDGTVVEARGTGGVAYANYGAWVKEIYDNDWQEPNDLFEDNSSAKVEVTILHTGHVLSARIIKRSGNTALDNSVQRTLNRIRFIRPFPEGTADKERTYIINFNQKSKRATG